MEMLSKESFVQVVKLLNKALQSYPPLYVERNLLCQQLVEGNKQYVFVASNIEFMCPKLPLKTFCADLGKCIFYRMYSKFMRSLYEVKRIQLLCFVFEVNYAKKKTVAWK